MVRITKAELEVMKVIWERERATTREIIQDLEFLNWKENTVRTLIRRLLTKNAIMIFEKTEKPQVYVALLHEQEFKSWLAKNIISKVFNNSIEEFCHSFMIKDAYIKNLNKELRRNITK